MNRWAILASPELEQAGVSDLLVAELSRLEGIELVEREAIELVLRELQLGAGGLVDPREAVKLGRLLSAEVLVLIHTEPQAGEGVSRVRLVETRTGIRLLDRAAHHGAWERGATQLLAEFRHALHKLRTPERDRRYVGMIGIRSEESGTALDPLARALTVLLERDLDRSSRFIVLERDQMQHLTAERDLTGIELRLLPSTVLIEGGLRRAGRPDRLRVTLKLRAPGAGEAEVVEVTAEQSDLDGLRLAMLEGIRSKLDLPHRQAMLADRREEAAIFAHQSVRLASQGRFEEAFPLAETALALGDAPKYHDLGHKLYSGWPLPIEDPEEKPFSLIDRLRWHIRAQQIDCAGIERFGATRATTGRKRLLVSVFDPLAQVPRGTIEEPERAEALRLQAELQRLCERKHDLLLGEVQSRCGTALPMMLVRLEFAPFLYTTAEQYVEGVRSQISALDRALAEGGYDPTVDYYSGFPLAALYRNPRNKYYMFVRLAAEGGAQRYPHGPRPWWIPGSGDQRSGAVWGPEEVRPLLIWLTEHDDPVNRMIGYCAMAKSEEGEQSLRAARKLLNILFDEIPPGHPAGADVLARLAEPGCRILRENGSLADWFEPVLQRAERGEDATPFVRWPKVTETILGRDRSPLVPRWCERILALLDAHGVDASQWRQAHELRHLLRRRLGMDDLAAQRDDPRLAALRRRRMATLARRREAFRRESGNLPAEILRVDVPGGPQGSGPDEQLVISRTRRIPGPPGGSTLEFTATRVTVDGGTQRQAARFTLADPGKLTCAAISPKAIFIGTEGHGFLAVTGKATERFSESEGAPGAEVMAMAWLDGRLYLGYPGTVAKFDPDTREFSVLASSKSVVARHKLDGGSLYRVKAMLADPRRGCIWLSVDGRRARERSGIWKYVPRTDRFQRVSELWPFPPDRLSWSDGKVYFTTRVIPGFGIPDTLQNLDLREPQVILLPAGEDRFVLADERLTPLRGILPPDAGPVEQPPRPLEASGRTLSWVGDVNHVWTSNRHGDTNWNPLGSTHGSMPGPGDVARFDGTLSGATYPEVNDVRGFPPLATGFRCIPIPSDVTLSRIDFLDVAAAIRQGKVLRLDGPGEIRLQGDSRGIAVDATWQDTNMQRLIIENDLEIQADVRIRRRSISHATGRTVPMNRNSLFFQGTIREDAPGRKLEIDNEDNNDPYDWNTQAYVALAGSNRYSGGTIINGHVLICTADAFGTGRTVTAMTRRDTTLEVNFRSGPFSGGVHVLDYDLRLERDPHRVRRMRIINGDCSNLVLCGVISGGAPGDTLEFYPEEITWFIRTITLAGDNTYASRTRIDRRGVLRLTGTLANSNITVAGNCTLEGHEESPGTLIFHVGDDASDRIVLESSLPGSKYGNALDARHLVIRFKVSGPLGKDAYPVVDYSPPDAIFIGSENESTGRTFAKAIGLPAGYELVNDVSARQVELRRVRSAVGSGQ